MLRKVARMSLIGFAMLGAAIPALGQQARPPESAAQNATETQRLMLSGHGPDDAVPWEFTIDSGRRAGEAATIPVPSNWQQHGFGVYQYGLKDGERTNAHGLYRRTFTLPATWKDRRVRLVFDGVMTDARVLVNGVQAGPVHTGGYYRFEFDVTNLVRVGEQNRLEVDVAEASANPDTERGERRADYWDFSGIFRPVWIEATPMQSIRHSAIDARANGDLTVDVSLTAPREVTRVEAQVLDSEGRRVGTPFASRVPGGGAGRVRLATRIADPKLWSAETPNLYRLDVALYQGDRIVHRTSERFGFRTFEVRPGDGLYLNGQRILLKGVNRHSFRPDTARTLSRKDNYDDVRTIRSLNMNAVRMAHYPPDKSFLEAADELGLYVLDELSGWQHAHDTETGRRLVREMVERDVNHPSILLWDNGNEGGFNRDLDEEFSRYDPQKRPVIHPWELFGDIDTKHYPDFADISRRLAGPHLVMPTEFLHALYDGGGGAGFEDYWTAIAKSPRGAGGFIWAFADEGIARADQSGAIDNHGTNAPDGIVGARHEKEASYFAVRDVLSPVQIETPLLDANFPGTLRVTNGYDFTPLQDVGFEWKLVRFASPRDASPAPRILARGDAKAAIPPHMSGDLKLALPASWREADALSVTARNGKDALWTWTWPVAGAAASPPSGVARSGAVSIRREADMVRLSAGRVTVAFDARTGLLSSFSTGGRAIAVANGPRLVAMGAKSAAEPAWTALQASGPEYRPSAPALANLIEVKLDDPRREGWAGFKLEISEDGTRWRTIYAGKRGARDPKIYKVAPTRIAAVRVSGLAASNDAPVSIASIRLGYEADRFARPEIGPVTVRSGTERDPISGREQAWLEADGAGHMDKIRWTLAGDGTLSLDYGYALSGRFLYHGISFDAPLAEISAVRALAEGPRPAWQNRLRGNALGVHKLADRKGNALPRPDEAGYYSGLRWARFETKQGGWTVSSPTPTFFRLGSRLNDFPNTSPDFPGGDISFLHAIPATGSKFIAAEASGPSGAPAVADGRYTGRLIFALSPAGR
jgi:hypothetical protein